MKSILKFLSEFILQFLSDKTVPFYVALGAAGLSVATGIMYSAALGGLSGYVSFVPLILLLVGAAVFVGLSFLGSPRAGAAIMTAADFGAFLVYVGTIYAYPVDAAMSVGSASDIKELPMIIAAGALMLICAIASNAVAWMKMTKRADAPEKDETWRGMV